MVIIVEGHWIGELLRDDESSSCNSFAHFCAKPKALGCDVTTAGVELFMGKTPIRPVLLPWFDYVWSIRSKSIRICHYKHQCRCYQPGHISASTGNLTGCMQECSFLYLIGNDLPCLKLNVLLIHITPLLKYILRAFMYSSFCYFHIIY